MNDTLYLTVKQVYGQRTIYPDCAKSQAFADIAKTRTLSVAQLSIIRTYFGYEFAVDGTQKDCAWLISVLPGFKPF